MRRTAQPSIHSNHGRSRTVDCPDRILLRCRYTARARGAPPQAARRADARPRRDSANQPEGQAMTTIDRLTHPRSAPARSALDLHFAGVGRPVIGKRLAMRAVVGAALIAVIGAACYAGHQYWTM